MESHSDSSLINISFNELYKFYTASNNQRLPSKSLILNNTIQFRLDLFPNGQKKEQLGYVQFIVVSNKLPSNIKSVVVLCRLYCKQAHILHKEIKIFNKGNETISWPIYYLHRDECKYNINSNNKNHLQFGCDLQLLHIKYHNASIMDNIKLKIRKNSVKNINPNDAQTVFDYIPLRTNSQIQYEWNINDKNIHLFKNARNGNAYYSNDFSNIWCLCCYPNGQYQHNEGQLLLALKLIRLPPKIKYIEAQLNISFQLQHKTQSYDKPQNITFSYTENNEYIWAIDSSPTYELFNNDRISVKFIVVIEIKKLFEDIGKNKGREISRTYWNQYGVDILGVPQVSNDIDGENMINRQKYSKSMVFIKQQSTHKTRSIRSQTHGYKMDITASPTSPDSNTFPRDLPLMSSVNTQSNRLSLDYSSNRSSFTNKMQPSLYKKITPTTTTTPTIIEEEEQKTFNEINIYQIKFKEWLNEVGLPKYYNYFEKSENADIRDITSFDHETLISIGIINKPHRNRIVASALQYDIMVKAFNDKVEKNKILNNCAQEFKRNGILTLNDLQNMSKNELKLMLNNNNVDNIWNLIHPESHLTVAINQLENTHNIVMNDMDRLMLEISEMNNKIKVANIISPSNVIKEKYDKIVDKTYRQLTQHHTQLNEFKSTYTDHFSMHSSRLKKNRHSTNTVCSINSSSKESTNTIVTSSGRTSSINYTDSHLSSKIITDGIDKDILINIKTYKKCQLIVYGYIRLTSIEFNMIIPLNVIRFCMNFYEKE